MSGGHGTGSVDVVRKAVIVSVLLAALVLLHQFAVPSDAFDPRGMLALGFVVLASFAIGELAEAVGLPHITGYLLAGLALGPSAAAMLGDGGVVLPSPFDHGILSYEVIGQLGLLDQLALALIALTAGGDLLIEQLRKAARDIISMVALQMGMVFVAVLAFVYVISLGIPGFNLEVLVGRPTLEVLALGSVVACIAMATSPAATIAVINGLGAKGPVTMRVLPGVVLSEVLVTVVFSAVLGFALSVTGGSGGGGVSESLMHLLVSVLLGLAVGFVTYAYLRWVGVELLLFLVGLVFATTWLAQVLGGEPALVFVAAGFSIANFSDQGERLIHEVERLSMPVYVVFFTLAGAKLHLDILLSMLAVAVGLWLVRAAAVTAGVKLGARLAGASDDVQKYAYTGFLSQAGMAISLSAPIALRFPGGLGDGLYALILAVIALNEMTGPVLLQRGLTAAGEAGKRNAGDALTVDEGTAAVDDGALGDLTALPAADWEDAPDEEAWGEPLVCKSPALVELVAELELDLHSLVRDVSTGPFSEVQEETRAYLRALRREFLRQHRRAMVRAQAETDPRVLSKFLVGEVSELAERWRDLALDRAARVSRDRWTPTPLVDALDAQVASLTELVRAPLEPASLLPRNEGLLSRVRRSTLQARHRVSPVVREVPVRDLARYHLSGVAVGRLESLCTLLVNADVRLADRTRLIFDSVATAYRRAAERAEQGCDAEQMLAFIGSIRDEVEADFAVSLDEFDTLPAEAAQRAARVFGAGLRALKRDVLIVGTLDLPSWHRRYSRVFGQRNAGLVAFDGGMQRARETVGARFSALALALEVVGLEGRMREAVEEHSSTLGRQVKGRAITQLARFIQAFQEALAAADSALASGESGVAVAAALRSALEPTVRLSGDVRLTVSQLRDWLANEESDAPLLEDLLAAAQVLTERYEVPVGRPTLGAWRLPTPVPLTEVPFREVAVTFIESALSRDLIDVTRRLAVKIDTLVAALEEVERVCMFNLGLAVAEIEVHRHELVTDETKDVAREMISAVHRSVQRLERLSQEAQPWPEQARADVRSAVLRELDTFRARVFDGEVHDLRGMLLREAAAGRRFIQAAGLWTGGLWDTYERWRGHARRWIGDDRLLAISQLLGIPDLQQHLVRSDRFALPQPTLELPVVYRRLFSDQALEAGDLLTGRQAEVNRARAVLMRQTPGALRTVAIVGLAGIGKGALVNAVLRGLDDVQVRRYDLRSPPTLEVIDAWFSTPRVLNVLTGFDHMFQMRGGGFELLERWVQLVVQHRASISWLVTAESSVWRFGGSVAPLDDAFGEVLHLNPLDVEGLERALLARHSMSGYTLSFRHGEDLGMRAQRLLSRYADLEVRRQRSWFRRLHHASGGVMHDALRLWLAAIESVDEQAGEVIVGAVPRPPREHLADLPAETWLTLRQVVQQGWTTPALHAGVFDLDIGRSEAMLAGLADLGLLNERDGEYFVSEHLRAPVCQDLSERGWL